MYNLVPCIIDQTVEQFLTQFSTLMTSQALVDYKGDTEIINFDRIKRRYNITELKENQENYNSGRFQAILIKHGSTILIPNDQIFREVIGIKEEVPDLFQTSEYKPFVSLRLQQLLEDPDYVSSLGNQEGSSAKIVNNEISVFMWVKSGSELGPGQGSWLNVSAFVDIISTNVGGGGGNFNISFTPVQGEYNPVVGWKPVDGQSFFTGSVDQDVLTTQHITKYDALQGAYKRTRFFFHDCVQENDLVMIRFERLANEKKAVLIDNQIFSGTDVPDLVYDMIGLIDKTSINSTANDIRINVTGRDLIKPLIEDGSVFFPEYFAQGGNHNIAFFNNDGVLARRNRIELTIDAAFKNTYLFNPIDVNLKFLFNKFSNIGYVPDSVFSGYGSRQRIKKYQLLGTSTSPELQVLSDTDKIFLSEDVRGVYRITNLIFDPQIARRLPSDSSLSSENGSLINSINKICQKPFVEFLSDTYGDQFFYIIRKPPFDKAGYIGLTYGININEDPDAFTPEQRKGTGFSNSTPKILDEVDIIAKRNSLVVDIEEEDVISDNLSYHEEAYSWYRIFPAGLGLKPDQALTYIPIVAFDEYGEVWGSRQLSVTSNYLPIELYNQDKSTGSDIKYINNQVFNDMKFLVESNSYLPFARQGLITINGNRTIKRGMMIRYKPTNEIFYVENVNNQRALSGKNNQRTTAITVTRGLVEDYIRGVEIGDDNISYFNIVKTEVPADATDSSFIRDWKVNKNVFDFFLQRRQWA